MNGPDPGDLGGAEDNEADLDVEWSGAVATNATIMLVTSQIYRRHGRRGPVSPVHSQQQSGPGDEHEFRRMRIGFGIGRKQFLQQSLVAGRYAGHYLLRRFRRRRCELGCDAPTDTTGSNRAVNGLASTPYNVAVGGTEFNEGSGSYWNTVNGGSGYTSAISYIPETAWNESGDVAGGSDLWATGGGVSSLYAKPAWQKSPGVPADGMRDVPDVSLSSAVHDAYLVETQGALYAIGGTSASSPSFAGLMALIVQNTGQRQGNANTRFYQLGNSQYGAGGVVVYHDITSGGNSVPGVTGYPCTTGFDQATGLGSVDANSLVMNWTPDFSISASPVFVSVPQGSMGGTTVSTTVSGNFSDAVSLSASGLPSGTTASFSPATIPAPGSGSSTLTINAGASTVAGTYSVTVSGIGGGITNTATVALTIIQTLSVTASVNNRSDGSISPTNELIDYGSPVTFTITPASGFILEGLTDNGVVVTAVPTGNGSYTYTIADVTQGQTIVATFVQAKSTPALGIWGIMATAAILGGYASRKRRKR